jgi:hypothetical protein
MQMIGLVGHRRTAIESIRLTAKLIRKCDQKTSNHNVCSLERKAFALGSVLSKLTGAGTHMMPSPALAVSFQRAAFEAG